ncbi:DUF3566 domain-containing protein [Rothia sp. AR01]|uniref:DUF3566 domain-containing protein n=1 Tax=Rothia santali TaxID=2949643 RepID=A0A9X2HE21_9MICC|nr:DUF3566 domain-containing protein [Rothia santali]MCP3425509.1 DUF3566 domain-containing protein [Rothia santali]
MSSNTPNSSAGQASAAGVEGSASAGRASASGSQGAGAAGTSAGGSGRGPSGSGKAPAGAGKSTGGSGKGSAPRKATGGRPLVRPAPRSKVRRAHLTIARVDLWSIAKLVFLLSVAVGIVTVVATVILWLVFEVTGVFNGINEVLSMLSSQGSGIEITDYLSLGQVAVYATILSVLNVVLMTLLGIISAFLYNVAAKLVGGIGVTLTDD